MHTSLFIMCRHGYYRNLLKQTKILNQACAGLPMGHAWFLKTYPVRIVSKSLVCVCVCVLCVCERVCMHVCESVCVFVCVLAALKLLITSGVI